MGSVVMLAGFLPATMANAQGSRRETATVSPAGGTLGRGSAAGRAPGLPATSARPRLRADFNGDGAQDLAVGAPSESVGTIQEAGAVTVLYGGQPRLAGRGSQLFTQNSSGIGSTAETADRFGIALAVGDFDGDGIDDLAVGAAFEGVGSVPRGGAVNVIYGSSGGLNGGRASQLFTQDSPGVGSTVETDDLFGAALAAGDLDGDGVEDLAVGAVDETVGPIRAGGAVNVIYGSSGGLNGGRASQLFTQDSPGVGSTVEDYDEFGGSLAVGDVNGSGVADLAVGAPGESVGTVRGAGAVHLLFGSEQGLTGTGSQLFHQGVAGIGSNPEPYDHFGSPLATGDFDSSGADDLAIGVVFESVGTIPEAGAIVVLYGQSRGLTGTGSQLFHQGVAGIGSDPEDYDQFGVSLSAGDFNGDGNDDLGVGVPFERVGTITAAGAINVLYGGQPRLAGAGSQLFHQGTAGIGSDPEPLDDFGFALAAGDFSGDGADDLAIGAAGESVGSVLDAGAVNVLYGGQPRLAGAGSQLFHQGTIGIGDDPETGDFFGSSLATGG